jgi:hypothetical protein
LFLGVVIKFLFQADTHSEVVILPPPQAEELARLLAHHMTDYRLAASDADSLEAAMKASANALTLNEVEAITSDKVISLVSVAATGEGSFEISLIHASGRSVTIRARYDFAEWLVGYIMNTLESIANLSEGSGTFH